jgi:hypothetical protein
MLMSFRPALIQSWQYSVLSDPPLVKAPQPLLDHNCRLAA